MLSLTRGVTPSGVPVAPEGGEADRVRWMCKMEPATGRAGGPPFPSVTTTVVWNDPVCVYVWVIWAPVPVVPSPNDQAYAVKVPGPPVAWAVNVMLEPGAAAARFADAVTAGEGLMSTEVEAAAVAVVASVTVHVTLMLPVDWYAWLVTEPLAELPSPKVHAYVYGAVPPPAVHVNVIDCPTSAAVRGELTLAPSGAGDDDVTVTPCVCAILLPPRESEAVTNGE